MKATAFPDAEINAILPRGVYFSRELKPSGNRIPYYAATWHQEGIRKIRKFYFGDNSARSESEALAEAVDVRSAMERNFPPQWGGRR